MKYFKHLFIFFSVLGLLCYSQTAKSQKYSFSLEEIQTEVSGVKKPIIDFRGKNIEVTWDLTNNVLSIPKLNKTYKITDLVSLGDDSESIMYKGVATDESDNHWRYFHYIEKGDIWNIFKIESFSVAGTSISYVCKQKK